MHADTLYTLAAYRGRDLEAAAALTRLRPDGPRLLRAASTRAAAQLNAGWSVLRPTPVPATCCA